jgi:Zn-dependent protease
MTLTLPAILGFAGECVLYYLIYLTVPFVSVLLHECGHAVAGWSFGLKLQRFYVGQDGGCCEFVDDAHFEAVLARPLAAGIVGVAGGAVNLLLAMLMLAVGLRYGFNALHGACSALGAFNAYMVSMWYFNLEDPESDASRVREAWQAWRGQRAERIPESA